MMNQSIESMAQDYLAQRRRLGFDLKRSAYAVINFARYADRRGYTLPLSPNTALTWARDEALLPSKKTWAKRLNIIYQFLLYLKQIDPTMHMPDLRTYGRAFQRVTPHIYTDKEISDLLAAAGKLQPRGGLRPMMYATLFGLLATTGLRLSEALNLRMSDVDFKIGLLTIQNTKFRKSRLVPLHPTAVQRLREYRDRHTALHSVSSAYFFASASGERLPTRTVQGTFEYIRRKLGWKPRGEHSMPRIHDLRHSFVCKRVKTWLRDGVDIDNAALALATYVGHVRVAHTYWYLTAVPELMAITAKRFEQFAKNAETTHA
jgi:integrase